MNYRMIAKYLSYLVLTLGIFLLPCVLVGLLYHEARPTLSLLATAFICLLLGGILRLLTRGGDSPIYVRDGYVVAGLGWILLSVLGALPYLFSGEIPLFADAVFESASGFTTTGASILTDVESHSRAILFWRSFTHWLGGIGVLVFVLVVIKSKTGTGFTMHLLRAESAGPQIGKVLPKTRQSVQALFGIYFCLSIINLAFLLLGGMPLFDALCTMFGTAGTGGFGVKNDSMAGYSVYLRNVTTVFMLLFGVNFTLYFLMIKKEFKIVAKDEELRLYLGIFTFFTLVMALILYFNGYFSFGGSLQSAAFTASSILTTTGFATVDFNLWPEPSRALILILMLCGGMAGSTGGGVKIIRLLVLFKTMRTGLHKLVHPRSIKLVTVNGQRINKNVLNGIFLFFTVYCTIAILTFALLAFEGFPLETSLSSTLTCLNNVGPGLGLVGPAFNFSQLAGTSKLLLALVMLVGRLEIFPILLLFMPSTWRRQ